MGEADVIMVGFNRMFGLAIGCNYNKTYGAVEVTILLPFFLVELHANKSSQNAWFHWVSA